MSRWVRPSAAAVLVALVLGACSSEESGEASTTSTEGSGLADGVVSECAGLVEPFELLVAELVAEVGHASVADYPILTVRVLAFLDHPATDATIDSLLDDIASWEGVSAVTYVSREEALEEAREAMSDYQEALAIIEEDPSILPSSIRITTNLGRWDEVEGRLELIPGVVNVEVFRQDVPDAYLKVAAAAEALHNTGLYQDFLAIERDAESLGCSMVVVGRTAGFSGFDPDGPVGELIIEAAKLGFQTAPWLSRPAFGEE